MNCLIVRVLTALIGLPFIFLLLHIGKWPLQLAVLFCAFVCLYEIYTALSKKFMPIHILGYLLSAAYIFILKDFTFIKFIVVFSSFIILLLVFLVFFHSNINIIDCITTLFGFFYVTFLLSFIILVRRQLYGEFFVWLIFISGWGCDTFAYFAGHIFGRHKLIPNLSPKKTVEGAIGGVLGSTLLAILYCNLFAGYFDIHYLNLTMLCATICSTCSVFAQLGDLSASAIKRYVNLKDYGNILPGHGGFLDRFDSILFTAPVVYIFLYFIRNFGG